MKKGHELNQGKRSPTMIERMNEKLHVKRFKIIQRNEDDNKL